MGAGRDRDPARASRGSAVREVLEGLRARRVAQLPAPQIERADVAQAVDSSSRVVRAVATIGLLQFLSMVLLLARTKILAVMLGPAAVGTMSVIDKLTALVGQTLSLSLPFAALRFLPAALRESADEMDRLYRRMRAVLLSTIAPATIACVAVSLAAPAFWGAELVPHQLACIRNQGK